jgi:mono/diheme cytochrome c family protein
LAFLASAASAADGDPASFFETRVRPLLARECYVCHTATHMGGLELNSRQALLKGGNSGPAVVPGKPDQSLLLQAVSYTHPKLKMPPSGQLRDADIRDLTEWIQQGAVWPDTPAPKNAKQFRITAEQRAFWSFRPIRKPAVPSTTNMDWPRSAIDRFVLAKLEEKGLQPSKPAEKSVLIRRAYLDLIGLPPTPEQLDAFVRDNSPGAFAKVVDQLLESTNYGERWGRYWLDIARYGDEKLASTKDDPYPNAFRYRDWVVQAFNEDMPYDLFVKAQLAADLLPAADREKYLPGLGFYGLSPEFQDDRVDVTTRGFMALTVACAQCHDHKYDPIPTTDFYALQGVFSSTKLHEYPLAPADVVERWQKQKNELDGLEKELKEFLKRETAQVGEILAGQISQYMTTAARLQLGRPQQPEKLDSAVLERWVTYLKGTKEHPYLGYWDDLVRRNAPDEELRKEADAFQALALSVIRESGISTQRRALSKSPRQSCGRTFTSRVPGPISRTVLRWACFTSAKSISIPRWNAR